MLSRRWTRLAALIRDAVFPPRCHGCRRLFRPDPGVALSVSTDSLDSLFADGAAAGFCRSCSRTEWVRGPMCTRCGLPFASDQGVDHLCPHCLAKPPAFDAARSAGLYQDALRVQVQDLKYRGLECLAEPLGRLLWAAFRQHWDPDDFDWFVPVPLHLRRLLLRGFNQAELLLNAWPGAARRAGESFDRRRIATRLLVRRRHTPSQTGLNRRQRRANLRQAFEVDGVHRVRDGHVLLVDDVLTTGATADACSRALKKAGAASVKVLTLARAV